MNIKQSLLTLYEDFSSEKNDLEAQILQNNEKIRETQGYLDSVLTEENRSLSVFSPRDPIHLYSDRIRENKDLITSLEEANRILYHKLNEVNARLELIQEIMAKEKVSLPDASDGVPSDETRRNLDEMIRKSEEELRVKEKNEKPSVPVEITEIQERERSRIARDLHDITIQNLTHTVHMIELTGKYIDMDPIRAKLELRSVSKLIRESIDELREIIYDLRPMTLDDLGFAALIEKLRLELATKTQMSLLFHVENEEYLTNKSLLASLFRIIREATLNAVKHSQGKTLTVNVSADSSVIRTTIEDDGIGISLDSTEDSSLHYGLDIMRERVALMNGSIRVLEREPSGTVIYVELLNIC